MRDGDKHHRLGRFPKNQLLRLGEVQKGLEFVTIFELAKERRWS